MSFSGGMQLQKENRKRGKHRHSKKNAEIYAVNTPFKTREKLKLNCIFFHIQVNTGNDVKLIPRNFWKKMSKVKFRKSKPQCNQFDGTVIKVMDILKGYSEKKNSSK